MRVRDDTDMVQISTVVHKVEQGDIACNDGKFIFFEDLPLSILNEHEMLQSKLDEYIIRTVEVRLGFDQSSGASNLALKT